MHEGPPDFIALDWNGTVVPIFGCPPYADVEAVIERFRARGIPVFVVSHASQQQIEDDVERIGMVVDGIYGCMQKAPVLSALRAQHGFGLLIGDHPADYRAAQEVGLPFLQARLEGAGLFAGCLQGFEHWSEVPQLLLAASGLDG
jgi:phosphoglycolate phosphatase-like HAD superfamily hydrolase